MRRLVETVVRHWRFARPIGFARSTWDGRRVQVEIRSWLFRARAAVWATWRAERIVRAARAPRVNMAVVGTSWRYRARRAVLSGAYALGEAIGQGYDAKGREELRVAASEAEYRLEAYRHHYSDLDGTRRRLMRERDEARAQRDDLLAGAVVYRAPADPDRRRWWQR